MKWFERSPEEQISYLEKKLKKKGESIWLLYLADLYFHQDDLERCEQLCNEYLDQDRGHLIGNIILGKLMLARINLPRAKEIFSKMYQLFPQNLAVLNYLAEIAKIEKNDEMAIELYNRILVLDPLSQVILDQLNQLRDKSDQTSSFFPEIEEGVPRMLGLENRELAEIKQVFAELHLGQLEEEPLEIGSENLFKPDDSVGHEPFSIELAEFYFQKGDKKNAWKLFRELMNQYPDHARIHERYELLASQFEKED